MPLLKREPDLFPEGLFDLPLFLRYRFFRGTGDDRHAAGQLVVRTRI